MFTITCEKCINYYYVTCVSITACLILILTLKNDWTKWTESCENDQLQNKKNKNVFKLVIVYLISEYLQHYVYSI